MPSTSANPIALMLERAAAHPDADAIVSVALTMTYGQLADGVRRAAARLRALGVRPGHVVGVRARPEWEALLTLAVLHEGAATLHASEAVVASYGAHLDVLLSDQPVGSGGAVRVIPVDPAFIESLGSVNARIDPMPIQPGSLCRVVFSSGTTGAPKGVAFTVARLLERTESAHANWMPADPFFCLLGIDTVSGFQTFAWSMFHGRPWIVPHDGPGNLALIERTGARSLKTSPARLADVVAAAEARSEPPALALEHVQVAGALLTAPLATRAQRTLGVVPTYLYGSTEAGTITRGQVDATRPTRVGARVAGAELEIVDETGAVIRKPGVIGAVRYRTASTPDRYWNGDATANAAFRDGWFWPGDRGSLTADGQLDLQGRADDVVNASGAKVSLAELDLWLAELDLLADLATFPYRTADGALAIGLVYVPRHDVAPETVREAVRRRAPHVEITAFVCVDAVPRNDRGKVTRPSLSRLLGDS